MAALDQRDEQLARVIRAAGNRNKLGQMLGITGEAISQWSKVPSRHLLRIEQLTGIPAKELRPDLV